MIPTLHDVDDKVAADLAQNLREIDRDELSLSTTNSVERTIELSLTLSDWALAGYMGDELIAVGGVVPVSPLQSDRGVPWLLATQAMERWPVAFGRVTKRLVGGMMYDYEELQNYVFAGHTDAMMWLRRLGFSFDQAAPHGPYGAMFCRFHWRR